MAKTNKTCAVCGEQYFYCNNCNTAEPSWKNMFHDENCKKIFETVNKLYFKHISEDEAVEILNSCDLSVVNANTANKKIKDTVDALMPKKAKRKTKKAATPTNIEAIVEDFVEEIIEEISVEDTADEDE